MCVPIKFAISSIKFLRSKLIPWYKVPVKFFANKLKKFQKLRT